MKIYKWVEFEKELEVDVSLEEIVDAISEETDNVHLCIKGINNVVRFLKAIPDDIVAEMTDSQRQLIYNFFVEQSIRYGNRLVEKI
jgi:hypothetical protein